MESNRPGTDGTSNRDGRLTADEEAAADDADAPEAALGKGGRERGDSSGSVAAAGATVAVFAFFFFLGLSSSFVSTSSTTFLEGTRLRLAVSSI